MFSNKKAGRQQRRPSTAKTKQILKKKKKKKNKGNFLGGPVDKIPSSQCRDPRFILDPGIVNRFHMLQLKILHATTETQHCQKK